MPVLTVDWVAAQDHDKGMGALLAADRRKLSLVDCISFDAMRRRGLRLAFAFDSHFHEQGFVSP
jgi:predicted nucleic acid-binding protein